MIERLNKPFGNETQRYAFLGAVFGLAFPVIATLIRITNSNLPFRLSSVVSLQSTDTLLWIIDTAPFFLGAFAAMAGRRQDKLQQVNSDLRLREGELVIAQTTLEKRVEERTADLAKRAIQLQTV